MEEQEFYDYDDEDSYSNCYDEDWQDEDDWEDDAFSDEEDW